MNCEEATNLISSLIDGEISSADQGALDAHLSACEGCRETLTALRQQDGLLRMEFAPGAGGAARVAKGAIEQIGRDARLKIGPGGRVGLVRLLVATAAGFAIAAVVFQPWKKAQDTNVVKVSPATQPVQIVQSTRPAVPASIGQLSLATGVIEVLLPGETQWQAMATGGAIQAEARVRTGPRARCEFVMADGSEVRLNNSSELRFSGDRSFALSRGQMWSTVAKAQKPFVVAVAEATITALGTQFDVLALPEMTMLTVVEGSTKVADKSAETVVRSGEQIQIRAGKFGEKQTAYELYLATRWVNDLLVLKGRDNKELTKRVDNLLAELGQTKMAVLYEQEIRSLGDHCVMPLTRYVQSDLSKAGGQERRRHDAARILADMAQPWSIPDLIGLLEDSDGEVRHSAAMALRRLTGQSIGIAIDQWRNEPTAQSRNAVASWRKWWSSNADKYPGGPVQAPAPMEMKAKG